MTAATATTRPPWQPALPASIPLRAAAILLLLAMAAPLLAVLAAVLLSGDGAALSAATLTHMLAQTLLYAGGVIILSLLLAVPTAWAVVMLNFPGRRLAVWMLLLPFALPPYITAYTYDEMLRAHGIHLGGAPMAIATTALALYPYIFFLTRLALRQQHCHIQSAARLLGCTSAAAFWRVSLPMARPAIGVGVALIAMECLNDIAVAEHYGVQTMGAGIYDLWLNRGDMLAGARLALTLTLIVLLIAWSEEHARRRQAQYVAACDKCYDCERAVPVPRRRAALLWLALLIPAAAGFWLPAAYLLSLTITAPLDDWLQPLLNGLTGSATLSLLLALTLLAIGMLTAYEKRLNTRGAAMRLLSRVARVVYAMPGTVIAQGVFFLSIGIYTLTDWQPLVAGGITVLLFACAARFYLIAAGALDSGMDKIPPQLDAAARLAAMPPARRLFSIHLPLLRPAAAAAAAMILLEGIKELPMTLILRPFNFDTLSTIIYQYASDESLTLAAPSALLLATTAATAITTLFLFEPKDQKPTPQA